MKPPLRAVTLLFILCARMLIAQTAAPSRATVLEAARQIMRTARYCTLVTNGPDGQPQARIVDPFAPDSDLTIWVATNPLTRKVGELRKDSRVTLLYFIPATSEYVTVIATAAIDTTTREKARHWKPEWKGLYKNDNRGDDYIMVRVRPVRLEVVSVKRGIRNDPKTWLPVTIEVRRP